MSVYNPYKEILMIEAIDSYKGIPLFTKSKVKEDDKRNYNTRYLQLIHEQVFDPRFINWHIAHICITIDEERSSNDYTKAFKKVFENCLYILKRENSKEDFNDNELGVNDHKGEHFHAIVFFNPEVRSTASFRKRLLDLRKKRNKLFAPKFIRNFKIVDSKTKPFLSDGWLEQHDCWFHDLDERRTAEYSNKHINHVCIVENKLPQIFTWLSYIAKVETTTSKTERPFLVKNLLNGLHFQHAICTS